MKLRYTMRILPILSIGSFLILGLTLLLSACGDSPTSVPAATTIAATTNAPVTTAAVTTSMADPISAFSSPVATTAPATTSAPATAAASSSGNAPALKLTLSSVPNVSQVALTDAMKTLLTQGYKGSVAEDLYYSTDNVDSFAKAVNEFLGKNGYKFRSDRVNLEANAPGVYLLGYVSTTATEPEIFVRIFEVSKMSGFLENFKPDQAKILQEAGQGKKSFMRVTYGAGLLNQVLGELQASATSPEGAAVVSELTTRVSGLPNMSAIKLTPETEAAVAKALALPDKNSKFFLFGSTDKPDVVAQLFHESQVKAGYKTSDDKKLEPITAGTEYYFATYSVSKGPSVIVTLASLSSFSLTFADLPPEQFKLLQAAFKDQKSYLVLTYF